MTDYPITLPAPQIAGFRTTIDSGLIRTQMPMHQAQRRVFSSMPHRFEMTFVMTLVEWGEWQAWVKANGFTWFNMDLPTFYCGENGDTVLPTLIRFTSPASASAAGVGVVQVSIAAETAPSFIANHLAAV